MATVSGRRGGVPEGHREPVRGVQGEPNRIFLRSGVDFSKEAKALGLKIHSSFWPSIKGAGRAHKDYVEIIQDIGGVKKSFWTTRKDLAECACRYLVVTKDTGGLPSLVTETPTSGGTPTVRTAAFVKETLLRNMLRKEALAEIAAEEFINNDLPKIFGERADASQRNANIVAQRAKQKFDALLTRAGSERDRIESDHAQAQRRGSRALAGAKEKYEAEDDKLQTQLKKLTSQDISLEQAAGKLADGLLSKKQLLQEIAANRRVMERVKARISDLREKHYALHHKIERSIDKDNTQYKHKMEQFEKKYGAKLNAARDEWTAAQSVAKSAREESDKAMQALLEKLRGCETNEARMELLELHIPKAEIKRRLVDIARDITRIINRSGPSRIDPKKFREISDRFRQIMDKRVESYRHLRPLEEDSKVGERFTEVMAYLSEHSKEVGGVGRDDLREYTLVAKEMDARLDKLTGEHSKVGLIDFFNAITHPERTPLLDRAVGQWPTVSEKELSGVVDQATREAHAKVSSDPRFASVRVGDVRGKGFDERDEKFFDQLNLDQREAFAAFRHDPLMQERTKQFVMEQLRSFGDETLLEREARAYLVRNQEKVGRASLSFEQKNDEFLAQLSEVDRNAIRLFAHEYDPNNPESTDKFVEKLPKALRQEARQYLVRNNEYRKAFLEAFDKAVNRLVHAPEGHERDAKHLGAVVRSPQAGAAHGPTTTRTVGSSESGEVVREPVGYRPRGKLEQRFMQSVKQHQARFGQGIHDVDSAISRHNARVQKFLREFETERNSPYTKRKAEREASHIAITKQSEELYLRAVTLYAALSRAGRDPGSDPRMVALRNQAIQLMTSVGQVSLSRDQLSGAESIRFARTFLDWDKNPSLKLWQNRNTGEYELRARSPGANSMEWREITREQAQQQLFNTWQMIVAGTLNVEDPELLKDIADQIPRVFGNRPELLISTWKVLFKKEAWSNEEAKLANEIAKTLPRLLQRYPRDLVSVWKELAKKETLSTSERRLFDEISPQLSRALIDSRPIPDSFREEALKWHDEPQYLYINTSRGARQRGDVLEEFTTPFAANDKPYRRATTNEIVDHINGLMDSDEISSFVDKVGKDIAIRYYMALRETIANSRNELDTDDLEDVETFLSNFESALS